MSTPNLSSISVKDAFVIAFNEDIEITKKVIAQALSAKAIGIAKTLGAELKTIDFEVDVSINWKASGKDVINENNHANISFVFAKFRRHDECPSCSKESTLFKMSSIIKGKESISWLCKQCVSELEESGQAFIIGKLEE
jgi:hypothetical protein